MKRVEQIDLTNIRKLIVGEGPSDRSFFDAFCRDNEIKNFGYAHAGMQIDGDAGNGAFAKYLNALQAQTGFENLTDIVLVADSNDRPAANPDVTFKFIKDKIGEAAYGEDKKPFPIPATPNTVIEGPPLRLHVLMVPWSDQEGGIETLCLEVAHAHAGIDGKALLKCVNNFAGCVDLAALSSEKKAKFRLQSFLSASWKKRPAVRAEQVWGSPKNEWIPLKHEKFDKLRDFLKQVEAL